MKTVKKFGRLLLLLLSLVMLFTACADDLTSPTDTASSELPTAELPTGERVEGETGGVTGEEGGDDPLPNDGVLQLLYDDRYTFDKKITAVESVEITSRVSGTQTADAAVLTQVTGNDQKVIATGTGKAKVTLEGGDVVEVEVKAAPISMLFLFGQSNSEGMILGVQADPAALARSQSVLCKEGTVYSTFAPAEITPNRYGEAIGGVAFTEHVTYENGRSFVASSLTSSTDLNGDALIYPLDHLSAANGGKSGMDSSIGYTWNKATGEKAWVINVAHSGSLISTWQPGTAKTDNNFWQAVGVVDACQEVLMAEIAAGHFTYSRMGYFWLQGCGDKTMSAVDYTANYLAMHRGFLQELAADLDNDGTDETLDFGGILSVRQPVTHLTPLDLELNGPRTSQFYMGTTDKAEFAGIYLASTLGDLFIGDAQVESYFAKLCPDGKLPYPTRVAYPLPTTVSEVHPDIHYRQPGYNALGMDAVLNILAILEGESTEAEDICLYRPNGYTKYQNGETVTLKTGEQFNIAALGLPGGLTSKGITLVSRCSGVNVSGNVVTVADDANGATGKLVVQINGKDAFEIDLKIVLAQQ